MAPICESCGRPANSVANPYYGTSLAVHDHIVICPNCGHVQFEAKEADRPPLPSRQRRGFFARLRRSSKRQAD
jgi:hypothetical protein